MIRHDAITIRQLYTMIKSGKIVLAGNRRLKIYGTLGCSSGKRMKKLNRIFFTSVAEAMDAGFRPCGNCLRNDYLTWKNGSV